MIRRLLVANRGEIARRIFATCRAGGIETVAVYSDADAQAPHVAEADYAVHLPGNAPTATYLRVDLLLAAARKSGADAVHPGYGFLAESAEFAEAVADAGLVWVGPPAKAIALLRSKLDAKRLLADAGLPVLPSYPDPEQVTTFPVLLKSSSGGGRGIRVVRDPGALAEAVAAARREAAGGVIFAEQYVEDARHIEIEVLADAHGNVVTFGERECSIQRRHQKIIEETPSPAVDPALRARLCGAAVAAARAVGYIGAGVVEFLLAPGPAASAFPGDRPAGPGAGPETRYYFLGMNARLQAEHAITECVAGEDLVRLQLLVAEGAPMPLQSAPPIRGHAIEVRLCAEDPAYAWLPATGVLHRFRVPEVSREFQPLLVPGLRMDAGVVDGSLVSVHYDSMLAKLVVWAPGRAEAARLLAAVLARSEIHGVVTNRDLLVRVLRHPTFLAGAIDTGFLDEHPEVYAPLLSSVDAVRLSCLAAALAGAAARRAAAPVLGSLPSGWRNVPAGAQTTVYDGPAGPVEVGYRLDSAGELATWWVRAVDPEELDLAGLGHSGPSGEGSWFNRVGRAGAGTFADHPPVAVLSAQATRVVLDVAGIRLAFGVHRVADVSYVDSAEGSVALTELPRHPEPAADQPDESE